MYFQSIVCLVLPSLFNLNNRFSRSIQIVLLAIDLLDLVTEKIIEMTNNLRLIQ
jgi:hypothetical protein